MPYFDLPLAQLKQYAGNVQEPADFDDFWFETLAESRAHELNARFDQVSYGLNVFAIADLTFNGFDGQPVKGWLISPKDAEGRLPCIVKYIGYGGGRGQPHEHLLWPSAGYAVLVMDTRGQGSTWSQGATPDVGSDPAHPGSMTKGILSKHTYYYRRVFVDAVRAIEAARSHPAIDPERIAVCGGSQGGGIAIAAAALDPSVKVIMADVPFLCDFPRAIGIAGRDPYPEIVRFLAVHRDQNDAVLETLRYFDGVCFSKRCEAAAFFSVALMDTICPPSTVYAAFNGLTGRDKTIIDYPFNDHEGGGTYHEKLQLAWLEQRL